MRDGDRMTKKYRRILGLFERGHAWPSRPALCALCSSGWDPPARPYPEPDWLTANTLSVSVVCDWPQPDSGRGPPRGGIGDTSAELIVSRLKRACFILLKLRTGIIGHVRLKGSCFRMVHFGYNIIPCARAQIQTCRATLKNAP